MPENPFQSPTGTPNIGQEPKPTQSVSSGHAAYNVVADTVTGVNVRWSDNRFQAVFIIVSMALGALVAAILAAINADWKLPWWGGALIGTFGGMVFGVFASGIFLMFYRAARHIRGKHD